MTVKTLKIPPDWNARIEREARASRLAISAVMREALARGLG